MEPQNRSEGRGKDITDWIASLVSSSTSERDNSDNDKDLEHQAGDRLRSTLLRRSRRFDDDDLRKIYEDLEISDTPNDQPHEERKK